MIFQLTTKNFQILNESKKRINKHLEKISRSLPNMERDLVVFRIIIRRNIDRYYPSRVRYHRHKSYADLKPALAYFEGSITFRLNKNRLYAHFKGASVDECINLGFERLFEKIEKCKDLHFPEESEYPDHRSIRGV